MNESLDPLDPSPFKKAPFSEVGADTARPFFTEMGYALHCWELAETSFASLFTVFVKPSGGNEAGMRAYGVVNGTGTHKEMIAQAAEVFFANYPNDDLQDRLSSLLKLYQDAGARRNDIAHGTVMGDVSAVVLDGRALPFTQFFLVPALHATKKQKLHFTGPTYRYGVTEIDRMSKCFEALGIRAGELRTAVAQFYQALPRDRKEAFP